MKFTKTSGLYSIDGSSTSSVSVIDKAQSSIPTIHILSSPARPVKSTGSAPTYTSVSIKRLLTHEKTRYRVECNPSKRATAPCWKVFGFPAMLSNESENQFEIIPGFASCRSCFETYRYIDSSTANLNSHVCPRIVHPNQQTLTMKSQTPRSTAMCKLLAQRKKEMTNLCARWVADSMRPFSIVGDYGLKEIIDKSVEIGRNLRSIDTNFSVDDILRCDRTVKNEVDRTDRVERERLKGELVGAAQSRCLSISPDIWTDNHRKISYLGATANYVDDKYVYHSIDIFCSEFTHLKKTAKHVTEMLEKQLSVFNLHEVMDKITFVSDRGSNFVSALRNYNVLYCVAHRLNNILKRTFYQGLKKKKKNMTPMKSFTFSTNITQKEGVEDDNDGDSEDSSDEDDDDSVDYTVETIAQLNPTAKQVLNTITHCKSLVKYAKKANLNRQLQMERENQLTAVEDDDEESESTASSNKQNFATTLHQSSISIKNAYASLLVVLRRANQSHRIHNINMDIVEKLIVFLDAWHDVLCELQTGNSPSLFLVLPCITHLRQKLQIGMKREKGGIRFFYKRAYELLNNMFIIENDYVVATFLHPNYRQLRGATPTQVSDCFQTCRAAILPVDRSEDMEVDEGRMDIDICNEPRSKRRKLLMTSLMDKNTINKKRSSDEVDQYSKLQLDMDCVYTDPLDFWKQPQYHRAFPNLARLAKQYFSIPCSSAAVERQFSAAGQIVNQRRSNLDPSTVNNIIFLRSIEKRKRDT
ncbi:unnamed protein product [Adineta ricciae]|uniref:HAT C-terminal dimerisation domain-containing protein n=1 Tax=Adineta ricciae TaxID=249248 RepID=A0A815VDX9_ADIRI|nr:unnamed protein product [Adineta ricciae]